MRIHILSRLITLPSKEKLPDNVSVLRRSSAFKPSSLVLEFQEISSIRIINMLKNIEVCSFMFLPSPLIPAILASQRMIHVQHGGTIRKDLPPWLGIECLAKGISTKIMESSKVTQDQQNWVAVRLSIYCFMVLCSRVIFPFFNPASTIFQSLDPAPGLLHSPQQCQPQYLSETGLSTAAFPSASNTIYYHILWL